jgi:hypothetical protein
MQRATVLDPVSLTTFGHPVQQQLKRNDSFNIRRRYSPTHIGNLSHPFLLSDCPTNSNRQPGSLSHWNPGVRSDFDPASTSVNGQEILTAQRFWSRGQSSIHETPGTIAEPRTIRYFAPTGKLILNVRLHSCRQKEGVPGRIRNDVDFSQHQV